MVFLAYSPTKISMIAFRRNKIIQQFIFNSKSLLVIGLSALASTQSPRSPAFRKDDTPLNRTPGGLMEQTNASLQRGDQG